MKLWVVFRPTLFITVYCVYRCMCLLNHNSALLGSQRSHLRTWKLCSTLSSLLWILVLVLTKRKWLILVMLRPTFNEVVLQRMTLKRLTFVEGDMSSSASHVADFHQRHMLLTFCISKWQWNFGIMVCIYNILLDWCNKLIWST